MSRYVLYVVMMVSEILVVLLEVMLISDMISSGRSNVLLRLVRVSDLLV